MLIGYDFKYDYGPVYVMLHRVGEKVVSSETSLLWSDPEKNGPVTAVLAEDKSRFMNCTKNCYKLVQLLSNLLLG